MKKQAIWLFLAFFIITLVIPYGELQAADPYYKGKVITIIVGYAPGGGFDRMSRLIAKSLPKHIPGNPSIIVQNMPGASSMIALNHLYNTAKPDGLTIGIMNAGLLYAQLTKAEGVRFDITKFSWIGSTEIRTTVFAVRSDLPYKTPDDFRKAKDPINVGGSGRGDISSQFLILLKEFLGFNVKLIVYPSTADIILALERKELDGHSAAYSSQKPQMDRGLVRAVVRGRFPRPGIENLPSNEDLTTDKKAKTIMAMLSAVDPMGRPFAAPPGTSPEMMKILRDAFKNVCEDPELKSDAAKSQMPIEFVSAEECLKLVNYVLSQPADIVKEFSKYAAF